MNRLNPNEWNRNGKWNWNSRTWQLVRYLCISSVTFISCIVRDRRAHVVWRETHGKFSFLKKLPIHVRAQQLATKKYCSSNANFIELFSVPFSYPNRWFGSVHWQHSVLCVCVYYVVAFLNTYTNHLLVAIIACWPIAAVCLFVFGSFQRRLSLSCESREPKIFIRFDANTTLQPICVPYHLNGRSF